MCIQLRVLIVCTSAVFIYLFFCCTGNCDCDQRWKQKKIDLCADSQHRVEEFFFLLSLISIGKKLMKFKESRPSTSALNSSPITNKQKMPFIKRVYFFIMPSKQKQKKKRRIHSIHISTPKPKQTLANYVDMYKKKELFNTNNFLLAFEWA